MKTKYLLTVMAIVAVTKSGYAQYSADALRFSQFQNGSTARIKALGNAGTAIGGDLSSISGNPAGLGFFTRSELSITPEFNSNQAKSSYFTGSSATSQNQATSNNLNFNNASVVFYNRLNTPRGQDKTKGWLSFNIGLSYNRTNDFYGNTVYGGANNRSSIVDYFKELANGDPFTVNDGSIQNFAYNHFLIDSIGRTANGNIYRSNVNAANQPAGTQVNQLNSTITNGGQTSFNLAAGANYSNKLYIGLGIGVTSLRYNTTSTFSESGYQYIDALNYNTQYTQEQSTKGYGFNASLGLIYKPVESVRLGANITTPTWYVIDDNYNESLNTQYLKGQSYADGPQNYPLSYSLRTPLKVSGGIAVFFQQFGFITGDVEYLDYSSIHLDNTSTTADGYDNNTSYDPRNDNNDVSTLYRSTVNIHLGAEARLNSNFSLRGGYGIQGSPYVNKAYGNDIKTISGGLGYRSGNYYVDATYANVQGSQTVYPYVLSTTISPYANIDRTYNNAFLTLGLRF